MSRLVDDWHWILKQQTLFLTVDVSYPKVYAIINTSYDMLKRKVICHWVQELRRCIGTILMLHMLSDFWWKGVITGQNNALGIAIYLYFLFDFVSPMRSGSPACFSVSFTLRLTLLSRIAKMSSSVDRLCAESWIPGGDTKLQCCCGQTNCKLSVTFS